MVSTQMENAAFHAFVRGVVQGVGYRYFAYRQATQKGITGYVRNLSDGRVEVFAEGEKDRLLEFLQDLKAGPSFAVVEDVAVKWLPFQGKFDRFVIETGYGW